MNISKLIDQLEEVRSEFGDIEVTCTGSTLPDGHGWPIPDVFESTVERVFVVEDDNNRLGTRVRLFM